MLFITTSAKTLDFETPYQAPTTDQPRFLSQSQQLHQSLSALSQTQLQKLMGVSEKLAQLNYQRYQDWSLEHTVDNSRPALFTYKGDIYQQMHPYDYTDQQLSYAHQHLRIVSGLYGLIRGLDLIKPYRLEMITKVNTGSCKDLYCFWQESMTQATNDEIKKQGHKFVINLASVAYAKMVDFKKIICPTITINFKENKDGQYKTVALYAKQARGMMIDYAIKNTVKQPEDLKKFDTAGYRFLEEEKDSWTFVRG